MRRLVELTGLTNRRVHRKDKGEMGWFARHMEAVVASQNTYSNWLRRPPHSSSWTSLASPGLSSISNGLIFSGNMACQCLGSLTIVSQKSWMYLTTLTNWARSTGFTM